MLNMESKIQLLHPAAKKTICMNKAIYNLLRESLLHHLKIYGASTHAEIQQSVTEDINKNETILHYPTLFGVECAKWMFVSLIGLL